MDFSDEDVSGKIDELFKKCQDLHRQAYPASSIDFDRLNLTLRVKLSRLAIGRGHYSDVYKGELDEQIVVGVKILRLPAYSTYHERLYESVLLRFFRELNYWHELDHLNVARLLGFTLAHGNIGFVSLWYPNGNLVEHLQKQPEASRPDLALDIAEGIEYLHTCPEPLIHGDLKAVNILIARNGIACLGDFGISKQMNDLNRRTGFTTTSGVAGTTPWMAPELFTGASVALESDIYAFAGVMIEAYCPGKYPYHYLSQEMDIILAKHRGDLLDPVHYTELAEQNSLWALVNSCMAYDPQARPNITRIVQLLYNHYRLSPRVNSTVLHRPPAHILDDSLQQMGDQPKLSHSADTSSDSSTGLTEMAGSSASQVTTSLGDLAPDVHKSVTSILLEMMNEQESYLLNLDLVNHLYMRPLRQNSPPIIFPDELQDFMEVVFGNILDLRELDNKLLEDLSRCRVQPPYHLVQKLGDTLVRALEGFRPTYPTYMGGVANAKRRLQEESETNREFRLLLEVRSKQPNPGSPGLEHLLDFPQDHLRTLQHRARSLLTKLDKGAIGYTTIEKAASLTQGLFTLAELTVWQNAELWQARTSGWKDLVGDDEVKAIPAMERKRQACIFEFISTEMSYVHDLKAVKTIFIDRIRAAIPPVVPRDRLQAFLVDIFYNIQDITRHHQIMLDTLLQLQRDQHPLLHSIIQPIADAMPNFIHAYIAYIAHYPIAEYRYKQENLLNPELDKFVKAIQDDVHIGSKKLNLRDILTIPLSRLPRYSLLLGDMRLSTTIEHDDYATIPQLLVKIKGMNNDMYPQLKTSQLKVDLWGFCEKFEVPKEFERFGSRLDLTNEKRLLLHSGWLCVLSLETTRSFIPMRSSSSENWSDVFVLLFDHFLVVTKEEWTPKYRKYQLRSKPIPLGFLAFGDFTAPSQQRSATPQRSSSGSRVEISDAGSRGFGSSSAASSSEAGSAPDKAQTIFPFFVKDATIYETFTFCFGAESEHVRRTWKEVLEAAKAAHVHASREQ